MDLKCETLLDSMNEDCLLSIFKLLELEDLMSVAETCTTFKSIVDPLFKKYSKFVLWTDYYEPESPRDRRDPKIDNRILRHTGHHVTSLEINCNIVYPCYRLFYWIKCENLQQLKINIMRPSCLNNILSSHKFDSLELLTMRCILVLSNMKPFLKDLSKLKCLNIIRCNIEQDDLQLILRNNPNIESFTFAKWERFDFDCQLLQLIPNVQKLALCDTRGSVRNLSVLCTLEFLTTLRIDQSKEIKKVLTKFVNKSRLKELELHLVHFDGSFVKVLKNFKKLEVLHVHANLDHQHMPRYLSLGSSVWPPNIKQLYLDNVLVRREDCISTIRQLEFLEKFDAYFEMRTNSADIVFRNISKLVANRDQKLYLALPWPFPYTFGGEPSGYMNRLSIDSDQLKIFHDEEYEDKYNSMNIYARFPGTTAKMLGCDCNHILHQLAISTESSGINAGSSGINAESSEINAEKSKCWIF